MKPAVKIGRLLVLCWATAAQAESVDVKYYGPVDLTPFFTCSDVTRSSFIERVCCDKANQYMIIRLTRAASNAEGSTPIQDD